MYLSKHSDFLLHYFYLLKFTGELKLRFFKLSIIYNDDNPPKH